MVAAAYLFNPYAIATCAARSSTTLDNAVLLSAIAQAANGESSPKLADSRTRAQRLWTTGCRSALYDVSGRTSCAAGFCQTYQRYSCFYSSELRHLHRLVRHGR